MTNWNDILKNRKEGKALILELIEDLKEDIAHERENAKGQYNKGLRADVDSRIEEIMYLVNRLP